ncbi:YkvI family membrane protein [Yaniella halotolerans]|uniref:YkvI family membrane protein n=1 Tax=Yaniella halotolerans TaxID=225453 RepID=UPI0003B63ACD|nr:membrane protein [Yaniella halotolerans]
MGKTTRRKKTHLFSTERSSVLRVLTYGGAIMAFLIGSGFATGQEIMQYYASYGFWGLFGTGLIVLALISFVSVQFLTVGRRHQFEKPSQIFEYYAGKYVGKFFDYFSILFVFLSFTVMVAGAGAVFDEHYNLPSWVGGFGLTILVAITVLFGLNSLVDVIGKIGPIIVVVAIGLGVVGILNAETGLLAGHNMVGDLDVQQASNHWIVAGLSYVGFCMLWLAAFLTALGKTVPTHREARAGGIVGGVIFSLACIVVGMGLLANIDRVAGMQIPMLVLAGDIAPFVASLISLMILAGIYTTAIPLLWTVSSRFFPDGTQKYKVLTIVLALLGTVVGLWLPFDEMVNIVYVLNGYVGAVLLGIMIVVTIWRASTKRRKAEGEPTKAATSSSSEAR